MIVLLDTTPLYMVTEPLRSPENAACNVWMRGLLAQGVPFWIPEIADYEYRRGLVFLGKTKVIAKLDALKSTLNYLPLTTATMLRAAALWAQARKLGKQTAGDQALDGDMILAAQAQELAASAGDSVVVATVNVKHLDLFVAAREWRQIP